ncbi:hypothetical protein VNI00_015736, partial [Paramarasmius palmivorus]
LVGGGVESRQWLVDNFVEDGLDDDYINDYKNDVRGENVVQIVIKAPHGLLRILWFGLADWENTRTSNPLSKPTLDVIKRYWLDDLADAMDEGDTAAYSRFMKRMVIRRMQEDDDPKWRKAFIDSRMADELVKEMEAGFSDAELEESKTTSASTMTLERRAKEVPATKSQEAETEGTT